MTTVTFHPLAGHHRIDLTDRIRAAYTRWQDRMAERSELARWNDRDLHDIGMSRSDLANELRKPFWRG